MARRAQSRFSIWHILLGAAGLGILAVFGSWVFFSNDEGSFRTLPELEVRDYLDNANSLRGNTYRLEGVVNHSLAWSSSFGRLFSVRVGEGSDSRLVAVLIPRELNAMNVQRGQRFIFRIEVVENGLLRVSEMEKA